MPKWIQQTLDGGDERWQIRIDRCLHDGPSGVEVPMSEVIAHSGDISPWNRGLSGQESRIDGSDGFADLDESNPDCVEDQSVVEAAPFQVRLDGHDGGEDVFEALVVASGHSGTASAST